MRPSEKDIYQKYVVEELSTREVAKYFGVSQRTVMLTLKMYNIPSRTLKNARSIAIDKGKIDFSNIINNVRLNNEPWNKDKRGVQQAWNKGIHVEQYSGNKHWNWHGGITKQNRRDRLSLEFKTWKRNVLLRDGNSCSVCNTRTNLHVHHIIHYAYNEELRHDISNGITVCAKCHRLIHKITNVIKKHGELLEHPEVSLATAQLVKVIAIAQKAVKIGQSAAEPMDEICHRKVQRSEHTPNRDEVR